VAKEIVALECTECKGRNYMTLIETRGGGKLERKKYCRRCRKHTPHKSRRK
jgi:large subunit ribosomal protein L33